MAFIELPEHTVEWHAHRLKFIGGSEIASLFGVQPNWADSAYALHHVKSGEVKPRKNASKRAIFGTKAEPLIAEMVAEFRGWTLRKGRYATDDTTPNMGASLDYEILDPGTDADGVKPGAVMVRDGDDDDDGADEKIEVGKVMRAFSGPLDGPGVLQIKQVDFSQYKEAWSFDEPPEYVLLQLQHEIACSSYKWGVIVCWLGGNDMRFFFYQARDKVIAAIRARVTEFWRRVGDKQAPPIDGTASDEYVVRELFPKLVDNKNAPLDLTGDNELPDICTQLLSATANRLAEEKLERRLKNRIREKMGVHTYAFTTGYILKCQVTPEKKPRHPDPGELIGERKETRKYTVTEDIEA
jgi:predicted phage-related endonuclease